MGVRGGHTNTTHLMTFPDTTQLELGGEEGREFMVSVW